MSAHRLAKGWLLHVLLFGVVGSHAFDYFNSEFVKSDARRTKVRAACAVGANSVTHPFLLGFVDISGWS